MTEYRRGLKAGIVSGVIFGLVNAIVAALIYWFLLELIPTEMSEGLKTVGIYTLFLLIPGKFFLGVVGGAFFGIVFAAFYNKLPGSKPIANGIVIAIAYWTIYSVFIGAYFKEYYLATYGITYTIDLIVGLILYLFWAFLLVRFWEKSKLKQTNNLNFFNIFNK